MIGYEGIYFHFQVTSPYLCKVASCLAWWRQAFFFGGYTGQALGLRHSFLFPFGRWLRPTVTKILHDFSIL